MTSCSASKISKHEDVNSNISMFIEVEKCAHWRIVYHVDTKVMYAVSCGDYNRGNFTLLVDEDGSPMVYEGNEP
jgi:hypothetical protein